MSGFVAIHWARCNCPYYSSTQGVRPTLDGPRDVPCERCGSEVRIIDLVGPVDLDEAQTFVASLDFADLGPVGPGRAHRAIGPNGGEIDLRDNSIVTVGRLP